MIGSRSSITDNRTEFDRFVKRMASTAGSYTKVGFPAEAQPGQQSKKGSGHDPATSISEVALIAAVHEFGSESRHIPPRPFIRPGIDGNIQKINQVRERMLGKIADGSADIKTALATVGEFAMQGIKKQLRSLKSPPLHQITIARKRSKKLLVDTAQMLNSITHVEIVK